MVKYNSRLIGFKVVLLFIGREFLAVPNLNCFLCKMGLMIHWLVLQFAMMHVEGLWIWCVPFIIFVVLHHNFFKKNEIQAPGCSFFLNL